MNYVLHVLAAASLAAAGCSPATNSTSTPSAPSNAAASPVPSPPPAAAPNDPNDPLNNPKLSPALRLKLSSEPDTQHAITVTFVRSLTRDEVSALGLTGEGDTVYGNLDRNGVMRLVASPDVGQISYRPPNETH